MKANIQPFKTAFYWVLVGHFSISVFFLFFKKKTSVQLQEEVFELVDTRTACKPNEPNCVVPEKSMGQKTDVEIPADKEALSFNGVEEKKVVVEKENVESITYKNFIDRYGKPKPKARQKVLSPATNTVVRVPNTVKITQVAVKPVEGVNLKNVSFNLQGLDGQMGTKSDREQTMFERYVQGIRGRIFELWQKNNLHAKKMMKATVEFAVDEKGLICQKRVVVSSGSANFDQSLLGLFESLPLLPPPVKKVLSFRLTFEALP